MQLPKSTMTDAEVIDAARRSLLPLHVNSLPSEAVLRELAGEPFVLRQDKNDRGLIVNEVVVWCNGDDFAISGTQKRVVYLLFGTYAELADYWQEYNTGGR